MRFLNLNFDLGLRRTASAAPDRFDLPETVYAVGDLHGRYDLLCAILAKINLDATQSHVAEPINIVFMGDYIDRGPASAQVLKALQAMRVDPRFAPVFLMGNHERAMLDFLDDPATHRNWLMMGGMQTLRSFKLAAPLPSANDDDLQDCAAALSDALGSCERFLRKALVLKHIRGNVAFCHAAMCAQTAVQDQPDDTLLWGDARFLQRGGPEGVWVVHGHTIVGKAEIVGNRIAIDTGAYDSGILTAARIDRDGCSFLTAGK